MQGTLFAELDPKVKLAGLTVDPSQLVSMYHVIGRAGLLT